MFTIPESRKIDTDLLVLGSGAAGCGAALAASEAGVNTLLVDKGLLESSGCLGGGNDHFVAVLNTSEPEDTIDDLVRVHNKPGSGYSEKKMREWGEVMPHMVRFLENEGVKLMRREDGSYLRTAGRGEPAWYINIAEGQKIKRLIAKRLRALGVNVLDHVMITKLLQKNGQIRGAVGFNVLTGEPVVISAKNVVLALGNSCNRASSNSTGNPYNTWHSPFNTGSQFVLAYNAGARILHMDIKQQATLVPKGFGCAGMNGINGSGAHELNALGERFMPRYHHQMENCPRQFQINGTHRELIEGRAPFHMEMRHIDRELLDHLQNVLMPGDKATFTDYREQRGVDFGKAPMEVEIGEIEYSGLIDADDNYETSIAGLYNGCTFYTFSGSLCSGYMAGRAAAARIAPPQNLDDMQEEINAEIARIFSPLKAGANAIDQETYEAAIRQVMQYYMGYVRNEAGMETAIQRLEMISGQKVKADNLHELMLAHEADHLLQSCLLSTKATLQRKESGRSVYSRADYPGQNPEYDGKILAIQKNGLESEIIWL